MNEKMDLEGHYPQNTISHCIISNETQITLHFFQARISAITEKRDDLFLAISTEALKGHRQRNNYLQCRLKILDKIRNIRSS